MTSVLEVRHASKAFPGVKALDDVSLSDLLRSNIRTPRFDFAGVPINVEPKN